MSDNTVDPALMEELASMKDRIDNESSGSDVLWYKPTDGSHDIRILPGVGGKQLNYRIRGTHWEIGKDKKNITCPRVTDNTGGKCAICEMYDILMKSGTEQDRAMAYNIRVKKDILVNLIDREDESAGVKVWSMPPTAWSTMIGYIQDGDYGAIWDPVSGTDFVVVRSKSGSAYDYKSCHPKRYSTPLHDDPDQVVKWIKGQYDFNKIWAIPSYAETYEAITGQQYDGDGNVDKVEEPELPEEVVEEVEPVEVEPVEVETVETTTEANDASATADEIRRRLAELES